MILPSEDRIFLHDAIYFFANSYDSFVTFRCGQHRIDQFDDFGHQRFFSAASCDSRSSDTNTGRLESRTAVECYGCPYHRR